MVDFDSVALFATLVDIALIPIWTKWWANHLRRNRRFYSVSLALFAFATLAIFSAAPFLLMRAADGSFSTGVANQKFLVDLAIFLSPSCLLQLWYVIYFARQHDNM